MKNILLILQALKNSKANIQYNIYGAVKDDRYWQQCREAIRSLPKNIKVTYHGDINPSKVEIALENSHVFILPSKSENFGHAIYEALSAGKPVITSHFTPWQKLAEAKAGLNVALDSKEEIVRAINYFAEQEKVELIEWSMGARCYSERVIDLEEIKSQYRSMFCIDQSNQHV